MSITTATIAHPRVARSRRGPLYVGLSGFMAAIALTGFWPGYFGPLVWGNLDVRPLVLHVHAAVFTGWLALFAAQAAFAATGRIRAHLRLGRVGVVYGVLLIVVGVYTTVVRSAAAPAGSNGEILLYVALLDMLIFAPFFGAAIWFRRRPHLHKRLMTVAATTLIVAAVARMTFLPVPPAGLPLRFVLWSSPILVAMAYDARERSMPHPVYLLGLLAFAVRIWSVPVSGTPEWQTFAHWLFGLVA